MKPCSKCGAKTSFERKNKNQPPEGQACDICDEWVCDDCVEWSISGYKHDIICKECHNKEATLE